MQPAVPRVPQAVLFLAAAKAPKQLPVECQSPANLVKTKKSAFLAISTQFCGNFAEFWPIFLHFLAIFATFANIPAPAPRPSVTKHFPAFSRVPNSETSYKPWLTLPLKPDQTDKDPSHVNGKI